MGSLLAASLLFAELAVAQFVSAPTNLTTKTGYAGIDVRYKEVPTGICELDPNVKSYSGFADVAENQHIFWWFFEARVEDPTTAPLTIWINGGPGSSSMIGLFQELGPCGVDYDGNVYNNPYSWSNVSNMIFIDQPTTTGFSYSIPVPGYIDPFSGSQVALPDDNCPDYIDTAGTCGTYNVYNLSLTANSTTHAASNFYLTLQGFMGAFPQYSQNGVYFTTESYGGHYGPTFSRYFLEQNELNTTGTAPIDLRGLLVGNGWYDPIIQYQAYYDFISNTTNQIQQGGNTYGIHYNASIDAYVNNSLYGANNCYDQLIACNSYAYSTNTTQGEGDAVCNAADSFCYNMVEDPFDVVFGRDEYDIRYLTSVANPDPFPYDHYVAYLNTAEVQAAIGVYTNFSESSTITGNAFQATGDDARVIGVIDAVNYVIEKNVTFIMYFGDADYNCNWFGGQNVSLTLSGIPAYTNGSVGFANISTSDGVLHGQVKATDKFAFVRIFQSGHEVPFYQPLIALEMLNRTIHGLDIATGETEIGPGYGTQGPVYSMYKDDPKTVTNGIIPLNATYNTTTNEPNPPYNVDAGGFNGTRMARAELDARKVETYGLPKWMSKRATTKKGRAALFGDKKRRHARGHRAEL